MAIASAAVLAESAVGRAGVLAESGARFGIGRFAAESAMSSKTLRDDEGSTSTVGSSHLDAEGAVTVEALWAIDPAEHTPDAGLSGMGSVGRATPGGGGGVLVRRPVLGNVGASDAGPGRGTATAGGGDIIGGRGGGVLTSGLNPFAKGMEGLARSGMDGKKSSPTSTPEKSGVMNTLGDRASGKR